MAPSEAQAILAHEVVVEEKIDGANIGFSIGQAGELRIQNRGSYLDPNHAHAQFRPLWAWVAARESDLIRALQPSLMLFGEWCFAVHSVAYHHLPDWFLGFDVYDRDAGVFWDTHRRDALLATLQLDGVPRVAQGRFSLASLVQLLSEPSRVGGDALEGLVLRREIGGMTVARAKLVRAEFTQAIDAHWSRAPLRRNQIARLAS